MRRYCQLQGVLSDDGTAASGAFVHDDAARAVVAWNIPVQGNGPLLPLAWMQGHPIACFPPAPPVTTIDFTPARAGCPYDGAVAERNCASR